MEKWFIQIGTKRIYPFAETYCEAIDEASKKCRGKVKKCLLFREQLILDGIKTWCEMELDKLEEMAKSTAILSFVKHRFAMNFRGMRLIDDEPLYINPYESVLWNIINWCDSVDTKTTSILPVEFENIIDIDDGRTFKELESKCNEMFKEVFTNIINDVNAIVDNEIKEYLDKQK